jgi:hypothetical protein
MVSRASAIFPAAMQTRLALIGLAALACLTLAPVTPVAAQPTPPAEPTPPTPPPDQPPTPPAEPAAPAPAEQPPPAETAPEGDSLEERLNNLAGQLESVTEPFPAMQADIVALKRLKFSGYIQGRYEWHDDADYGLDSSKTPPQRGTNRFYVRRGRLKTTYVGTLSEYVLQFDATGDGLALRDAEASFHITNENPWFPSATEWELKLTMGQFKVPFGFEVLQSSGDRELPERTAVIRALFPGERDRGIRLQYSYAFMRLAAAVFNGNFTNDSTHGTFDQSSWKDFAGRLSADLDHAVIGVSGHWGRFLRLTRPASMTQPIAGYERYKRYRFGVDAQGYLDVPSLGGLTLRVEAIWAKDTQMDFGGAPPDANGCKDTPRFGWYATVVQNLGDHAGIAVRFDQYDPITSLPDACAMAARDAAGLDKVSNIGVVLMGFVSGNLKASLAYEHFIEEGSNKKANDAVTLQMQAKF